jgi:hypothetical protein
VLQQRAALHSIVTVLAFGIRRHCAEPIFAPVGKNQGDGGARLSRALPWFAPDRWRREACAHYSTDCLFSKLHATFVSNTQKSFGVFKSLRCLVDQTAVIIVSDGAQFYPVGDLCSNAGAATARRAGPPAATNSADARCHRWRAAASTDWNAARDRMGSSHESSAKTG